MEELKPTKLIIDTDIGDDIDHALAYVMEPTLLTTKAVDIAVELNGQHTRGLTVPKNGNAVKAAVNVDVERFMKLFMEHVVG